MWTWAYLSPERESSSVPFLNELLRLFGYPSLVILLDLLGALLDGTLPFRYCTTRFDGRIPTWRLPMPGLAAALVTSDDEVPGSLGIEVSGRKVLRVSGSGVVRKEFDQTEEPLHTSLVMGFNVVHRCGRGCVLWSLRCLMLLILRGGVAIRVMQIWFLLRSGLGLDDFLGSLQADTSRSACR